MVLCKVLIQTRNMYCLPKCLSAVKNISRVARQNHRHIQTHAHGRSLSLTFAEHGDPVKVMEMRETELPVLKKDEVLIKMMAAPINPADINTIQGVYPIKPHLPAVAGNEGVGKVVDLGADASNLLLGDWVIPASAASGTWCTYMIQKEKDLLQVPSNLPLIDAAVLAVNPCTAYRLLADFEDLQPGDTVIQNGANSGVGLAVIQLAAQRGISTINIIRARPEGHDETVKDLLSYGATHVITEEFVRKPEMLALIKSIPKAKLALNCVGGKNSAELLKHLAKGGTMVTYGGMSKKPMMVPAGPLIFNDVKLRGFWMTSWNQKFQDKPERGELISIISTMISAGTLKHPPVRLVPLVQFKDALVRATEGFTKKQVLIMEE